MAMVKNKMYYKTELESKGTLWNKEGKFYYRKDKAGRIFDVVKMGEKFMEVSMYLAIKYCGENGRKHFVGY